MINSVIKREGFKEEFKVEKVIAAIVKAMEDSKEGVDNSLATEIAYGIAKIEEDTLSIEDIQDIIEEKLMKSNRPDVAKQFILFRQDRTKLRRHGWKLDDLQKAIWSKKYQEEKESFNDWVLRVSGCNHKISKLIKDRKFLFGGRILAHRGVDKKVSLSNCYVMEAPKDNLESIFETATKLARTYSFGGGCGVDISELRPRGAKVNNSARNTTGAVSFMELYDKTTGLIGQNGRRGALMISIADSHPDLPEFIDIKAKDDSITKANISIRVSDDFMMAVENDEDWTLKFTVKDTGEIVQRTLKARELFRKNSMNNWDWAEAGNLFWTRIESWHMMSEHPNFQYAGVNPCAEEPLLKWGSCLLGSINLSEFILHPFTNKARFDVIKFEEAVMDAVIGLNEVLEEGLSKHPLKEQRETAANWRQIGLGIMGLSDMLIKLSMKYGSEESLRMCDEIAGRMLNAAVLQSALLSKEFGAFPMYDQDTLFKSDFFNTNITDEVKSVVKKYGLRNSQLLTIAPTGSLSTMLGVSGGIEPIYNISYTRRTESLHEEATYYKVYTPIVKEYMDLYGIEDEKDLPGFFVTAMTLDYKDRIEMQSVWQKYIDASISSTVNLPKHATVEQVEDLFMLAWKKGLKGITIFRDGCRRTGVLTNEEIEDKKSEIPMTNVKVIDDKYVTCAECGEKIQLITNGCAICQNCGYSPCS